MKQRLTKGIISIFIVLICQSSFAVVAGDMCSNPIPLDVLTYCNLGNFTCVGATSEVMSDPSCGWYFGGDVWFSVIVPANGKLRIQRNTVGGIVSNMALYSGTCGSLTELECNSWQGDQVAITVDNFSLAGQTLLLRVWRYFSSAGCDFTLCATEETVPVNDLCVNATELIPDQGVCTMQYFTNEFANAGSPAAECFYYLGADVWFKSVIPASGKWRVELLNIEDANQYAELYIGNCGNLEHVGCLFTPSRSYTINDIALAGETVYIRVYDFFNPEGSPFTLCTTEPDIAENDHCESAIPLTVQSTPTFEMYENYFCTSQDTAVAQDPSCGFYLSGDVWFTIQVPLSGHLRIERLNGGGANLQFVLYQGTCGDFEELECFSTFNFTFPNSITLHDESLAGQILYLRVYNLNNNDGSNFYLSAWEPLIPDNDFCSDAFEITPGTECNMIVPNNAYCTGWEPLDNDDPGCGFFAGGDVWFTFEMPASGHLRIETAGTTEMNPQFTLYYGTCGNLIEVDCAQLINYMNIHNDLLAGEQMYLRVYNYGSREGGEFQLCVWEPPMPDNDFCPFAELLTYGIPCAPDTIDNTYCTSFNFSPPTCGFYNNYNSGDIWYKAVVPSNGQFTLNKNPLQAGSGELAIYSGTCAALNELVCLQLTNHYEFDHPELAGETILFRFFSYGGLFAGGGKFTVNLLSAIENCAGDFDGNGVVNTGDLLLFMAMFGEDVSCGGYDMDGNSTVNTSDLLLFMADFGSICGE